MKTRYYRSKEGADASQWLADRWRSFSQDCFKPFGAHELDSAGAVLADAGDERVG